MDMIKHVLFSQVEQEQAIKNPGLCWLLGCKLATIRSFYTEYIYHPILTNGMPWSLSSFFVSYPQ